MKIILPQRLKPQGLLFFIGGMISLCALFLTSSFYYTISGATTALEARVAELETTFNTLLPDPLWQHDILNVTRILNAISTSDDVISIHIHDDRGMVYAIGENENHSRNIIHRSVPHNQSFVAIPIVSNNQSLGEAQILLDQHYYTEAFNSKIFSAVVLGTFLLLVFTSICWRFFQKWFVAPLTEISHKADAVISGTAYSQKNKYKMAEFQDLSYKLDTIQTLISTKTPPGNHSFSFESAYVKTEDETLLQVPEARLHYLINNAPDTLYIINLQTGKYEYISPSSLNVTGYTPQELMHLGINGTSKLFHPNDKKLVHDNFKSYMEQREAKPISSTIEYRFQHKKLGYRVISDTRTVLFDDKSCPLSIIGSARDVTRQKHLELEKEKLQVKLRQSQKMEAMGTLMGGIAHDFNNILGAILGFADIARESVAPGSSVDRDLREIITAGDRAKEIVRQILAYCRQEPQKQVSLCVSSIVKESTKLMRASIPSNINIYTEIDSRCGNVLGEPTQLHQVVINLFTNAAHAVEGKADAHIRITLTSTSLHQEVIPSSLPSEGKYVVLRVEDNGIGIDTKIQERVFDPYFTTKEAGKGSGMGLAIVLGIVRSHGGDVRLESTIGKGTVVSVFLPEAQKRVLPRKNEGIEPVNWVGSILLVDDEETIARVTARRLEKHGYTVTSFIDSRKALDAFKKMPEKFDIVISDQTMPGLTGDQLCGKIKAIRADIPIIICTGYSERVEKMRSSDIGVEKILIKPVNKNELLSVVANCLGYGDNLPPN